MELVRFLARQGFSNVHISALLESGKVVVVFAGSQARVQVSLDEAQSLDIGYGDKVYVAGRMYHHRVVSRHEKKASQKGSSGLTFTLPRIALATSVFLLILVSRNFKSWSDAYKQNQEKAKVSMQLEVARDLEKQQRIDDEAAQRLAQEQQRRLRAEQEKERQENVPMGISMPVRPDRTVAVTNAALYDYIKSSNTFASPISGEGGQILVVFMTITNTGTRSGDMAWTSFSVLDGDGLEYSEIRGQAMDLSLWMDEMGLGDSDDQLFPGQSKQIAKVFRVRRAASGMKLVAGDYRFKLYR